MKRWWIFWILAAALIWLVVSSLAEVEKAAGVLAQGQGRWILAALMLQALYYLVFTSMFALAFRTVGVRSSTKELLPATFGAIFVNTVTPTWGLAGVALYIQQVSRRGQPAARAAAGSLLAQASDFATFTVVLVAGLSYLFIIKDLTAYEIFGAGVLLMITLALCGSLILGLVRPRLLGDIMEVIEKRASSLAKSLRRRSPLEDDWAEKNLDDFTSAARAIRDGPDMLMRTLATALAAHLINISSLYALFLAFHQPIGFGALVAGYSVGVLFWNVSPVPQGVGVVEGVMALVFTSLGVSGSVAAVIVLAFRGINFWLPMAMGFLLLRKEKVFG